MEFAEFKSTLAKMVRAYKKECKTLTKLYDTIHRMRNEIKEVNVQILIESNLLSEWEWEYGWSSYECIVFICKNHCWHQLEKFDFSEGFSHWSVPLSPDGFVRLREDDSEYSIIITNTDPEYVQKWIMTLGLKVDTKMIETDIESIRGEIARLENFLSGS